MKHLVKIFVVTLILVISTSAFAEQKIVVMDMTYVLNNSKAGKEAQDFLKKKFNDNAKKLADIEKKLREDENDLLAKKTILSKEEYTSKSNDLRKQVIDYQSKRRSSIDKLTKQRAEARETLVKKVEPLVDNYIKENQISLVIDKKYMIGGLTEFDITNVIVEKLNKELPSLNLK